MSSIEDVIEEINTVGKDWPDEKKCRIIYREVMQRARYNPVFSFLSEWEQESAYSQWLYTDKLDKIFVTCNQVGMALEKYLNEVGIKAYEQGMDNQNMNHTFVVAQINSSDDKQVKICLDTFQDLMYAKKGMRLRGYGISSDKIYNTSYKGEVIPEISEEMKKRAEQYDIERGYIYTCKVKNKNGEEEILPVYFDDVLKQLKEEMKDEKNIIEYIKTTGKEVDGKISKDEIEKYKIHFIIKHLKNNGNIDITQNEWERYFSYISKKLIDGDNAPNLKQYRLGNIRKRNDVDMMLKVDYKTGEREYYIYDQDEKGYVLKSKEMIKEHLKKNNIHPIGNSTRDIL